MRQNETLTAKQRAAIDCVVRNRKIDDAVKCAGVSKATLYRWLDDPTFSAALEEERNLITQRIRNELVAMISDATKALGDALTDELTHPARVGVRVRAAVAILDTALRIEAAVNLEQRLNQIEQYVNETQ